MDSHTSHNRQWRHGVVMALLVGLATCTSSTAPTRIGSLTAAARNQQIELVNRTPLPVFTMVLGRSAAALIDWMPCVDPVQCPPIAPGARRNVPYPEGLYGVVEHEALVYWWHATPGSNGVMRPDSIRVEIVQL